MSYPRRVFLEYCTALGLAGTLFPGSLYAQVATVDEDPVTVEMIEAAERLAGLSFTAQQREMMVEDLNERLQDYASLREVLLPNSVVPALVFDAHIGGTAPPMNNTPMTWAPGAVQRPSSDEALAYMTVAELSSLLRSGQVTSRELTGLYLARLKRYDSALKAVVTLTEERALRQAVQADAELAAGQWRGPLHGIPYGAKDLLSVEGYPTTWGAMPYRNQMIDETATVVRKLDQAGAVLVAKLTLGALAWGDVWFGGTTKNPWNIEQGSSGSSAGPGAAVAAGLVGFAIGSETLGSIVSPSTRNGVTGHRPTFGTVSRHGAMTLSWTMDKLGPMARSAEDCALVYEAIRGPDPADPASVPTTFPFDPGMDVRQLRVGYLAEAFEAEYDNRGADLASLEVVRGLVGELQPISLPSDLPIGAMLMTLEVEAAAAFDELTRTNRVDEMVRQTEDAWPHVFRTARMVPAVEFIQASRARTVLMQQLADVMQEVDVFIAPSFQGETLRITNLTGHPCVCLPNAFRTLEDQPASNRRQPGSFTVVGGLHRDAEMLALGHAYQQATDFHRRRPPIE